MQSCLNPFKAINNSSCWKIRRFNNVNQLWDLNVIIIDVSDDRGNRIMFRMRKEDGTWKIIAQPLPEWVAKKEATFHDVIEEELRTA